jgi:ubiquinone/menaquinone biosynthesis C-methylase UbiE
MKPPSSSFAGSDREYLRTTQYGTSAKLADRGRLHALYSVASESVFEHLCRHTPWRQASEILEVGAGPGWWWNTAAQHLHADAVVTITDLSPGMVEESVARLRGLGCNVTGRAADAVSLPFADDSFDLVAAHYMLYHVPDPLQALQEFRRVLRPGGTLVAASNGPNHMLQFLEILTVVFGDDIDAYEINNRFPPVEGLATLRTVFSHAEWHPHVDALRITNVDDALQYLRSFPPGESATAAEVDALRRELARRAADGVLHIQKETGLFVAQ